MKFLGITFFWIGIIMLLKNVGLIQVVDSGLTWAVVFIISGSALKHGCHHGMMSGSMMKMKGGIGREEHKCMGADCSMCNK